MPVAEVLSATEAAQRLGISAWLLRKLCRERKIRHRRIAGRVLLTEQDVADVMERMTQEPLTNGR